jgi:hypothetical protein
VQVPDNAVGWSYTCRQCGNSFTLAAGEDSSPPSPEKPPAAPERTPRQSGSGKRSQTGSAPASSSSSKPRRLRDFQDDDEEEASVPSRSETVSSAPSSDDREDEPRQAWLGVDAVSAFALCCAGVGLLTASFPPMYILTVILTGAGLLLGLVGLLLRRAAGQGILWPAVALVVSVPVLGLTLFFPDALGGRPTDVRSRPDPFAGKMVRVPLNATPGTTPIVVEETEWVDASRELIRLGEIAVRVTSAAIQRLDPPKPGSSKSKEETNLAIRLRIQNVGTSQKIPFTSWAAPDSSATLRDSQERLYKSWPTGLARQNKPDWPNMDLPPFKDTDDVLEFEVPRPGAESLRLELPAGAFGGNGLLRFRIPGQMIGRFGFPGR